jgi:hypothetical protein
MAQVQRKRGDKIYTYNYSQIFMKTQTYERLRGVADKHNVSLPKAIDFLISEYEGSIRQ